MTTCTDSYPDLHLCDKHYGQLPKSASMTALAKYKPNTLSSLKTQFVDLRQLARRSFKAVKGGKNEKRDDKIHCSCLWPKTLICRSCRPLANEWKMQQMDPERDIPVCAYCRFP